MAKYNKKVETPTVINHQGGEGVRLSPKLELISLLSAGLEDRFYEKESEQEARLMGLINTLAAKDPEFVAKALVYTRSVTGQRSITHVGASMLLPFLSGNPLGAKFFSKRSRKENKGGIVYRLDDMLEILSYFMLRNPEAPIPNAVKKGFKSVLETADAYELAKYQAKRKEMSLVDLVNLVHPKPSEKMQEVFKDLMTGKLLQFNTAEDKQTKSGQEVAAKVKAGTITEEQAEVELKEAKAENWKQLIEAGTLGYLALLRNLRNIVKEANDEVFTKALLMLIDENRIRKSLVFPHQIDLAFEVLLLKEDLPVDRKNRLLKAVNTAYELAIPNLTSLFTHGQTAVVFDSSGSMQGGWSPPMCLSNGLKTDKAPADKAALIAATLCKGIGADMYHFADYCESIPYNPLDTVNTIKNVALSRNGRVGGGTSFSSIFETLSKKYDRVFIVSDMQGGDDILRQSSFHVYKVRFGQPYIYSINLQGYGTTMFKQDSRLIQLFGYSKDIYEYIKVAEIDPSKILKEIEAIVI